MGAKSSLINTDTLDHAAIDDGVGQEAPFNRAS